MPLYAGSVTTLIPPTVYIKRIVNVVYNLKIESKNDERDKN